MRARAFAVLLALAAPASAAGRDPLASAGAELRAALDASRARSIPLLLADARLLAPDALLRVRFDSLYAQWQEHLAQRRMIVSDPKVLVDCPPFRGIEALGPGAVPLVMGKLRSGQAVGWRESEFLLWRAAETLTGAAVPRPESVVSEQEMARRYLAWWESRRA